MSSAAASHCDLLIGQLVRQLPLLGAQDLEALVDYSHQLTAARGRFVQPLVHHQPHRPTPVMPAPLLARPALAPAFGAGADVAGTTMLDPNDPGSLAHAADEFSHRNQLDGGLREVMRSLTAEQLAFVVNKGDIQAARNPNAVIMKRVKDSGWDRRTQLGSCTDRLGNQPMGHQPFPDNKRPRLDPPAVHQPVPVAPPAAQPVPVEALGDGGDQVGDYCARNNLDERMMQTMYQLSPDILGAVLAKGDLTEARNPNAVMVQRIKAANNGQMPRTN